MSYSGAATAKAARENLGRSLASLQDDPNIPQDVLAVAQNLAQAVGKLFEAERASNEVDGKGAVKAALGLIGQTLALLQDVRGQHRGVQNATESLALSMSSLYPLTTVPSIRPPAAAPAAQAGYPQPGQPTQAYVPPSVQAPHAPAQRPPQSAPQNPGLGFQATHPSQVAYQPNAYPQPATQPSYPQPTAQPSSPQPAAQPAFQQPAAQPSYQQPSYQQPSYPQPAAQAAFQQPAAQPSYPQPAAQAAFQQPAAQAAFQQPAAQAAFQQPAAQHPTRSQRPQQAVPVGYRGDQNREKIEVNIGATTESNFFVGFSTEISEGGVFAATYNIQPRGTPMIVHITLPGGFDQIVHGVVRFVRDPMDMSAEDTVPGMGIQFEGLDPQARELILRFIRKRPPMFYDE